MDKENLKILSDETGKCVVHMPDCRFPGVVIQGDRLHELYSDAMKIVSMLESSSEKDSFLKAIGLAEQLESLLDHYEATLKNNYFKMPYARDRENTSSKFRHSDKED